MGQPTQSALDILGPADAVTEKPKGTLYRWSAVKDNGIAAPDYDPDVENRQCTIQVLARPDGTILRGRITGTPKSCRHFDDAINDHFPYQPNGHWINRAYLARLPQPQQGADTSDTPHPPAN
jgi:hypothetical protein